VTHDEAIAELKLFVIHEYDGSIGANFKLDKLLWEVRLAHPHNHPSHKRSESGGPRYEQIDDLDKTIEIDLEELGL
jgi:hypothetical protein